MVANRNQVTWRLGRGWGVVIFLGDRTGKGGQVGMRQMAEYADSVAVWVTAGRGTGVKRRLNVNKGHRG